MMAANGLPEGWAELPFENGFVHVLGGDWGKAPEKKPSGWIDVRVIRGTEFRNWDKAKGAAAAHRSVKPTSLASRQLRRGDIVVEISGGGPEQPVGRSLIIDDDTLERSDLPVVCSNFCRQVRIHPDINPFFVNYCLRWKYSSGEFNRFQNQTVNIRNLQFPDFARETVLPIPPPAEQKRIVAMVEKLLARLNAARERLAKVPAILKRFRQSVLAAACSGRLTADWRDAHPDIEPAEELLKRCERATRADRAKRKRRKRGTVGLAEVELPDDLPSTWSLRRIKELENEGALIDFQDGNHGNLYPRKSDFCHAGIKFLTAKQVFDNCVLLDDAPLLAKDKASQLRIGFTRPGDVLLTHNATVGRVAVMPDYDDACILGTSVTYFRFHCDAVISGYGSYYMQGPLWQDQLHAVMEQTTRNQVSVKKQAEFWFVVPPLEEQHEIVRRVEALFKLADTIERRVTAGRQRADRMTQAVLAKAFRGELVPTEAELARREGCSYEPASALLERIKAERGNVGGKTRRSSQKRRKTRSVN